MRKGTRKNDLHDVNKAPTLIIEERTHRLQLSPHVKSIQDARRTETGYPRIWLMTANSIENPKKCPPWLIERPGTGELLSCCVNCVAGAGVGTGGAFRAVVSYAAAPVYDAAFAVVLECVLAGCWLYTVIDARASARQQLKTQALRSVRVDAWTIEYAGGETGQ